MKVKIATAGQVHRAAAWRHNAREAAPMCRCSEKTSAAREEGFAIRRRRGAVTFDPDGARLVNQKRTNQWQDDFKAAPRS
jgi:hypothetical protein